MCYLEFITTLLHHEKVMVEYRPGDKLRFTCLFHEQKRSFIFPTPVLPEKWLEITTKLEAWFTVRNPLRARTL